MLTAGVAVASLFVKSVTNRLQSHTDHLRNVREKLLDQSYNSACNYLMPLAGVAAEMARYMRTYRGSPNDPVKQEEALDGAFYNAALYVRINSGLMGTIPLVAVPKSLGVFLNSAEAEGRVWCVLIQPWALGVDSLPLESVIAENLIRIDFPREFIEQSKKPDHDLNKVRQRFLGAITQLEIDDLVDVLCILNKVINSEVRAMLVGWYPEGEKSPDGEIKALKQRLSETSRKALGVLLES